MESITFSDLNLSKQLQNAVTDLGFTEPTPIQVKAFSVIRSGKDMVGVSQTGTGKTLAYSLPILQDLSFSEQIHPRVLILVPTRELVVQVAEQLETYAEYMNCRIIGVYGGVNINTQKIAVSHGMDILVATPGRLYDLVLARSIQLKSITKLVIDEVDVMLDLGFRFQLTNLFELMPKKRQNTMFSATMTNDISVLIEDFFTKPEKVTIEVSGTPLDNIEQSSYAVPNFYTKANLLMHLVQDAEEFSKVLVFLSSKRQADRLYETLEEFMVSDVTIVHSNKSQNYRLRSIKQFEEGEKRILISTDVMARGLDIENTSHVINFDTPEFPENYMHRIGRTGRAGNAGKAILFFTEKEAPNKTQIEALMDLKIPVRKIPNEVEESKELTPDEKPKVREISIISKQDAQSGAGIHKKKAKNQKVNLGSKWKRDGPKYKKPKSRGDKGFNQRYKKK
ncbi:DEAD/DEAH box helicase [Salibacteraceae bacterium]|nr:DEAD/DEAH box helicase [Salibacteraceae bacterium]MDB9725446.1 DEAD/DEAH box helicase [Salibacteraceae bacterium]